jgi:hypothetical protein
VLLNTLDEKEEPFIRHEAGISSEEEKTRFLEVPKNFTHFRKRISGGGRKMVQDSPLTETAKRSLYSLIRGNPRESSVDPNDESDLEDLYALHDPDHAPAGRDEVSGLFTRATEGPHDERETKQIMHELEDMEREERYSKLTFVAFYD